MSSYLVQMQAYLGNMVNPTLQGMPATILVGAFGAASTAPLVDVSGVLNLGEEVKVGGHSFHVIASGSLKPGYTAYSQMVVTGATKPFILLQSSGSGHFYFAFPEGVPSVVGAAYMKMTVAPVGYDLPGDGPLCFVAGTMVLTCTGLRPVESLKPGQRLIDPQGQPYPLLKLAHCHCHHASSQYPSYEAGDDLYAG